MELFANNTRLPFSGSMTLKFYNPLFNQVGNHSLPISTKPFPAALRAFGFAGKKETDSPKTVPARIKTHLLDLQGSWEITESSERIEAYYKGGMGDFYSSIRDKLLTEIDFGGIKFPAGQLAAVAEVLAFMSTKMNAVYPDDEFTAFCSYMPFAYGTDTAIQYSLVNEVAWNESGVPIFKNKGGSTGNDTVYLFVGTVLDYMFKEQGYRIGRNIFAEDTDLKRLVVFNTHNRMSSEKFDYSNLVPAITCKDFLKSITNRFNIGFFINEHSKTVDIITFGELLSRKLSVNKCRFTSAPSVDNRRESGVYFPINAPDEYSKNTNLSPSDFLRDIQPNMLIVDKLRDIPLILGTLGNVYLVKAASAYYKVVYVDSVYKAQYLCQDNFNYKTNRGETEYTQYSGIPGMCTYYYPLQNSLYTLDMTMPRCDLEASPGKGKNLPLMFMFSRGINEALISYNGLPGTSVSPYPLGSVGIYDAKGTLLAGASKTLYWQGEKGLIKTFWENRIEWEMNTRRKVKGALTNDNIDTLIDFTKVQRIEGDNYIVNSIEVELNAKTTRIREAELLRL